MACLKINVEAYKWFTLASFISSLFINLSRRAQLTPEAGLVFVLGSVFPNYFLPNVVIVIIAHTRKPASIHTLIITVEQTWLLKVPVHEEWPFIIICRIVPQLSPNFVEEILIQHECSLQDRRGPYKAQQSPLDKSHDIGGRDGPRFIDIEMCIVVAQRFGLF